MNIMKFECYCCERCGVKYQYIGDGLFHEYCLRVDCKEEEE